MNRPTLLIGGGYDKQSGYDEWIEAFDGKVRYLVLIGQTKEKIKEAAEKHGFHDIILCEDLKEAVRYVRRKHSLEMLFCFLPHVQAGDSLITMNSVEICSRNM